MAAILFAAIAGGLLANRALIASGVNHVVLRYPLSVLASFLAFVLTMRLWLSYLSRACSPTVRTIEPDDELIPEPPKKTRETSASRFDGIGDPIGVDAPCGCLLIVFIAVVAVIGGSAAILIYEAPVILTEIAFQFFLAAGLLRSARKMDSPDWIGSVMARTWMPFAVVLLGPTNDEDCDPSSTAKVHALYVTPTHWGRGIGRSLISHAIGRTRERGVTELRLWTVIPSAGGFYERLGFVRDGAEKVGPLLIPGCDVEVTDIRYRMRVAER